MTEALLIKPHAEFQLSSVAASAAGCPPALANGESSADGGGYENAEEPFTIKCVCGYDDDDGETVLCDKCDSWQHIICYYKHKSEISEVHLCVDCHPRDIDRADAAEKQRRLRESHASNERRRKQPTTKSHKKKGKDAVATVTSNGWPHHTHTHAHAHAHDRTSGSPRDQPPPAKRPKTTHRSSGSLNVVSHPSLAQRKRANSATAPTHSPIKSPSVPLTNGQTYDFLSPEFVALCQEPTTFTHIDSNNFSPDHRVIQDLRNWLDDPDALYAVTNKKPQELFHAYNGTIEDLENLAPTIIEEDHEFEHTLAGGLRPRTRLLRVGASVSNGSFIGELKGRVGRREDYIADLTNRWSMLRHPEPFVFFPPSLPIYIDARAEGTRLRYVRRSCDPNVRIQIIITNGNYHFCIVACKEIPEGDELTINWEVPEEIVSRLRHGVDNGIIRQQGMSAEDVALISKWASCLFANFGGCACQDRPCVFDRFDRRSEHLSSAATKSAGKKARKNGTHISPPSTGRAVNSRAGSEVQPPGEPDYESADGRSFSGSNRSKPTSRDITPITQHLEPNFGLGADLSEREKRKLQLQEERAKHEGVKRTKKRNSAGSALNTPSVNTSKQLGSTDSSDPSPTLPTTSHRSRMNGIALPRGEVSSRKPGRSSSNPAQHRRTSDGSTPKPQPAPKPVYVDCAVQTDPEPLAPSALIALIPKTRVSYKQSLIERMRQARLKSNIKEEAASTIRVSSNGEVEDGSKLESNSEADDTVTPIDGSDIKTGMMLPPPLPAANSTSNATPQRDDSPSIQLKQEDIEMRDVPDATFDSTPDTDDDVSESKEVDSPPDAAVQVSQAAPQPPPPPWTDEAIASVVPIVSPTSISSSDKRPSPKPMELRVQLPPAQVFPVQSTLPTTPSAAGTPGSGTTNSLAQSPSTLTPSLATMFPPSGANLVQPSPVKKKMTLSDYTKRKNSEALQAAAAAAHTSTGVQTSADTLSPGDGSSSVRSPLAPRPSPLRDDIDMPLAPSEPNVASTNVTLTEVDKVGS